MTSFPKIRFSFSKIDKNANEDNGVWTEKNFGGPYSMDS